jgi:hypothetical protein
MVGFCGIVTSNVGRKIPQLIFFNTGLSSNIIPQTINHSFGVRLERSHECASCDRVKTRQSIVKLFQVSARDAGVGRLELLTEDSSQVLPEKVAVKEAPGLQDTQQAFASLLSCDVPATGFIPN